MRVYKKGQLRLIKEEENSRTPLAAQPNDNTQNTVSNLGAEISKVNADNPEGRDIEVDTAEHTPKQVPQGNEEMTMEVPNNSQGVNQVKDAIANSPAKTLPGRFVLKNSRKRNGNIIEGITFTKSELDKFLRTI